ncbi:hypothetical protein Tco_1233601 [Tanacetum coccineum]
MANACVVYDVSVDIRWSGKSNADLSLHEQLKMSRVSKMIFRPVTEMMKRVYDFIKSEEVYQSTKFPRGEFLEKGQRSSNCGDRPSRTTYGGSR